MRFNAGSLVLAFLGGIVFTAYVLAPAVDRVFDNGSVTLKEDLYLCADGSLRCSPEQGFGGVMAGTRLRLDTKGFVRLGVLMSAPNDAYQAASISEPRLQLVRPSGGPRHGCAP
jgi:hypothetical protein